jgi:hypothetical protein
MDRRPGRPRIQFIAAIGSGDAHEGKSAAETCAEKMVPLKSERPLSRASNFGLSVKGGFKNRPQKPEKLLSVKSRVGLPEELMG